MKDTADSLNTRNNGGAAALPKRRRALKAVGLTSLAVVLLGGGFAMAFIASGWESFGEFPQSDRLTRIEGSPNWRSENGRFENPQPQWSDISGAYWQLLFGEKAVAPKPVLPVPVFTGTAETLRVPPRSGLRYASGEHRLAD